MWRGLEARLQVERKGARSEGWDFDRDGTSREFGEGAGGFDHDQTTDAFRRYEKYWVPGSCPILGAISPVRTGRARNSFLAPRTGQIST